MLSDWLKTQKKPPRTNQIRAVLATKFKKMAMVLQQTTTSQQLWLHSPIDGSVERK